MAYPVLPTSFKSDPSPIKSLEIDRAEDGTARVRSFFAADKSQIKIDHPWLSVAQKSTLDAFYAANRLLSFDYLSPTDNITRECVFAAPPKYERKYGEFWSAEVQLEEV